MRSSSAPTFPAGWNLISAPEGSHLKGASGSLYTLQPGDSAYEVLPVDTALKAGWGYWANFPNGGNLDVPADSTAYRVSAAPGQWIMIGNPSASAPATVTGADTVFTYTQADGYQQTTTIPPGLGAWAIASSQDVPITVTPTQAPATPAPTAATPAPTATPQPSPAAGASPLTTSQGLKSFALNETDLPQYTLSREGPVDKNHTLSVADYRADWLVKDPQSRAAVLISNTLITGFTVDQAHGLTLGLIDSFASDPANSNVQRPGVSGLGDEVQAVTYQWHPTQSITAQDYVVVFRRGRVVVIVLVRGLTGGVSLDYDVSLAHIIDGRLAGVATNFALLDHAAAAAVPDSAAAGTTFALYGEASAARAASAAASWLR